MKLTSMGLPGGPPPSAAHVRPRRPATPSCSLPVLTVMFGKRRPPYLQATNSACRSATLPAGTSPNDVLQQHIVGRRSRATAD